VVFELKRGTLTRAAVAQIIDYSSYLSELEPNELSDHISSQTGRFGIEKIDDFLSWYQEEFSMALAENQRPKMVLVGLGADEKTKRMVSFLSESDLDISLITFHGFKKGDEVFLARQVEVQSNSPGESIKLKNLEALKSKVKKLNIETFYYDMAELFREKLPVAYEWPNQGGYSYGLPEQTESGSLSNRVYVALYVHDSKPGQVQVYLYSRSIEAASNYFFAEFKDHLKERLNKRGDGAYSVQVNSKEDWLNQKNIFTDLCKEILKGWNQKRAKQSKDEFDSAETNLEDNEES
jgi:hypothetical protein